MSFELDFTNRFKKDVKLCVKRNYKIHLLEKVLLELRENGILNSIQTTHFKWKQRWTLGMSYKTRLADDLVFR